uniref:Uncharacterized protein n=1 Tax=Globodera rostochiensis TaxID=31243 RepID=A0A914GYA4_GLORO
MEEKQQQQKYRHDESDCNRNKEKRTNDSPLSQLLFKCFLLIFVASLPGQLSTANVPKKAASAVREDLLCNLGSEYECICNRSSGNLDNGEHVPCQKFIEAKRLEVVSMVLRDIKLNVLLHTNETYEQYLRRRIAKVLSQYCDNMPTECPGTLADLRVNQKTNRSSTLIEINNKTTAVIDDEPVFSRESVVILRVIFPPGRVRTEIAFVVVKRTNTIRLNPTSTLNPTTVKYILSAQIAPLSRVLGGIRIEQFGIEVIEKSMEVVDNTKLLIMIGVIGVSVFFCCIIAAFRQICLLREARNARRQNKSSPAANEEKKGTRNYGTCTDKFFSNYDLSNGHVKSKSFCSRDSTNSSKKTKRVKKTSKCSDDEAKLVEVLADRIVTEGEVSPRPYQNIFICDHSQLPKEEVDDEFEMEIQRTKRQNLQVRSPRSPFSSDDDAMAGGFQGFYFPERPPTDSAEKRNSVTDIPSVVLNDEQTRANSPPNVGLSRHSERNLSVEKGDNLWSVISGDHPFERPLSRRGSVNEAEQEEGEEGTYNEGTREDTPDPLGDEQQQNAPKEKPLIIEEEEDALYQPLKEERWKVPSNGEKRGEAESSSEGEESVGTEKAVLDRHNYERLMESPGALTDPPKVRKNTTPKIILND